jgi:outer membrane lipoprotein SlyB
MNIKRLAVVTTTSAVIVSLGACATGAEYKANSYSANQVNQRQEAHVVQILAITPAQVQVDNTQGQKAAMTGAAIIGAIAGGIIGGKSGAAAGGALLGGGVGAIAGSAVSNRNMVEGVSITYKEYDHVYNSAQVGRMCEYKLGQAITVSSRPGETRVQANSACADQTTAAAK